MLRAGETIRIFAASPKRDSTIFERAIRWTPLHRAVPIHNMRNGNGSVRRSIAVCSQDYCEYAAAPGYSASLPLTALRGGTPRACTRLFKLVVSD